ncbi:hypothetical protein [Neptuniibacter halophilus]|uniref:hypothetical protein n=1 Tax=Neptuniibacter halophilus TaxID=651666 RepID=UPI00257234E8|nr:hypothetical protein [Neptuniibacter halophilus]
MTGGNFEDLDTSDTATVTVDDTLDTTTVTLSDVTANEGDGTATITASVEALLPLITEVDQPERFVLERHLCIDTTAAGGNASLIAAAD